MKIAITQDSDGDWYWIPQNLFDEFLQEVEYLSDKDYLDDVEAFENFNDKYSEYRTGGDINKTPEAFKGKTLMI